MLPKTNIVLPFNGQYFRDTIQQLQYNTGVVMQDNAAQNWWGVQNWQQTQFQILYWQTCQNGTSGFFW